MNDSVIIDYINNEIENEFIDFKLKIYEWSDLNCKSDFLSDVISLSNSNAKGDKYIITGVKIKADGERIIKGIDKQCAMDSAVYQELVTENIEPSISIEFKILEYNKLYFGIFRIIECKDRPYLLKKKYGNYESGYIKIRRGSRNTNISRYILDSIYNEKIENINSQFKISGIVDGKISDNVVLNSYNFFPDLQKEKEELISLTEVINNFKIDDLKSENTILGNNFKIIQPTLFSSENIKLDEELIHNIKAFAEGIKIKLNENFFDIGNASKRFSGFSSIINHLGPSIQYEETGSNKSLEKYRLILELNRKIMRALGWVIFLDKIKNYKFIQLAISEVGNVADEEIEVSIELPKGTYVDTEKFPEISDSILKEVSKEYFRKMFMPQYRENISDFRKMPLSAPIHIPSPPKFPFYDYSVDSLDSIYDFIDYDVLEKDNKTIISFTIKNIKVGETMVFPGNIILNNKIDSIEYSIISKFSKNKCSGKIIITE